MRCIVCGGNMEERLVTPEVVDKLQAVSKLIRKGDKPPKTVEVPVFSLTDAEE